MKKALVVAMVMVMGLGVLAFAGPLTGTWDMSISIDPGATQAGDLFIDLSTSLALDYTVAGWTFGSSSTFDSIGWSAQSFTASGVLGAFTFDSTMNFLPRTITSVKWDFTGAGTGLVVPATGISTVAHFSECWVTDTDHVTYGYGAAFDDWTATGAVSIAGVSFEGLFYLEGYAGDASAAPYAFYTATGSLADLVQTAGDTTHVLYDGSTAGTTGSGFRFMASGSAGDLTITSYTYFSLSESFATVTCGQSLTKSGTYTVDGCDLGFTEEYIHVDGFSFGCATFEMGLDITCTGFNWISFKASSLDLGLGWAPLVADFQVTFGTKSKTAALCFDFTALETTCFTFGVTLDYSGTAITGVTIDSVTLSQDWNGISFSSTTDFNSFSSTIADDANKILFMVPVTGMTDGGTAATCGGASCPGGTAAVPAKHIASVGLDGIGYYDAVCVNTEEYRVWESFTISSEGDSCCGGGFTFDVTTSFGTKYELDAWAYDYQFDDIAAVGTVNVHRSGLYDATETGDAVPTVASVTGGTDLNGDGVVDTIDYTTVVGAKYQEQLLTGTVYEKATQDQLFQWVSTKVDVSYGLSSTWDLTFGLDIDVYGWNSLSFGFDFTF